MGTAGEGLIVKRLSQDAVFRIEVSLSSRKSSAIVMRTTARLYSLQGTAGGGGASGEGVGLQVRGRVESWVEQLIVLYNYSGTPGLRTLCYDACTCTFLIEIDH